MAPEMTKRERYLTALRGGTPDEVCLQPEMWSSMPKRLLGLPFYQVGEWRMDHQPFTEVPRWKAQLEAARRFDVTAWVIPVSGGPVEALSLASYIDKETEMEELPDGGIRVRYTYQSSRGPLTDSFVCPPDNEVFHEEGYIKDFEEDWERYSELFFADPWRHDVSEIDEALEATGEDGIVSALAGSYFIDFIALARDKEINRAIMDLYDHRDYLKALQERYIDYMGERTRMLCQKTGADEIYLGCGYSMPPLISPQLFQEWDVPVLRRICEVADGEGVPVHIHQHGYCREFLEPIVDCGVALICPLEAHPRGDVDLAEVKRTFGDRIALKGNISNEVLEGGTPDEVGQEVKRCISQAGHGGRFILGTSGQVPRDTPFANMDAMREACRLYGRYPLSV